MNEHKGFWTIEGFFYSPPQLAKARKNLLGHGHLS